MKRKTLLALSIALLLGLTGCGGNNETNIPSTNVSTESEIFETFETDTDVSTEDIVPSISEDVAEPNIPESNVAESEPTEPESTEPETTQPTEENEMTYEIDPTKPMIAITFDDGPNTLTTVQILDLLEEYEVRASFFVIGNNINDASAEVMKRAHDMGCEIANHSQSHSMMNQMTAEDIAAEIKYTSDKVEEIVGEAPRFFRPPYIAVNSTMYDTIDMPFICGYGCNDWENNVTAEMRSESVLKQAEDGAIILLHDFYGNSATVEALKTIIPALKEQGYQFVTVSELFEAKGVEVKADDTNLYSVVK